MNFMSGNDTETRYVTWNTTSSSLYNFLGSVDGKPTKWFINDQLVRR